MDLQVLAQLIPLGGVSVLLIYLLGLLMTERASWVRERAVMIDEWNQERARMREEHRSDMARTTEDLSHNIAHLRSRVVELEAEVADLRLIQRGQ